ncbi:MAG: TonB-dependent receptor plug domain-containing protein [Acidobacteriota bacterium]
MGSHGLAVVKEGYDAATGLRVEVRESRDTQVEVTLKPFTLTTTVEATREDTLSGIEDTISSNEVRPEDIKESPGGLNDVNRVLQTLPGVVTESDFSSAMYVRGGGALETMNFLDRAFLWNPYHLGGFNSLFSPDLIDKVDFYAGGFPARYPNALSAVVDVTYRDGRAGPVSGKLDLSTVDASVVAEGSITRSSTFIAQARRTYFDLFADRFRDAAVPFYDDYYARYTYNPRPGQTFTCSGLWARDGLELSGVSDDGDWTNGFTVDPDDKDRGHLFFENEKLLGHLGYTQLFGDDFLWDNTLSYLDETTTSDIKGQDPYGFNATTKNLFYFSDLSKKLSESQLLEWGIQYAHFAVDIDSVIGDFRTSIPGARTTGQGGLAKIPLDVLRRPNYWGLYVQHRWEPAAKFELRTGLRGDYWSETGSTTVSPRLDVRYHFSEKTSLRFAWGIFHQIPTIILQTLPGFGNPHLAQEQSTHYVLGLKQDLPAASLLRVEAYWKKLDDLVVNPDNVDDLLGRIPTETTFTNDGSGRSYGLELFLQRDTGNLTGWITYGYGVTRRKNPLNRLNPAWYYPLQDQRHTVSLVGTYHAGEKWTFGGKLQYNTGKPDTAVTGWTLGETEEDPPEPYWIAEYGPVNGARFPSYFKIDLRAERKLKVFGLDGRIHLDVLNASNRKNVYVHSYTKGDPPTVEPSQRAVYAMPLLPFLGFELKF